MHDPFKSWTREVKGLLRKCELTQPEWMMGGWSIKLSSVQSITRRSSEVSQQIHFLLLSVNNEQQVWMIFNERIESIERNFTFLKRLQKSPFQYTLQHRLFSKSYILENTNKQWTVYSIPFEWWSFFKVFHVSLPFVKKTKNSSIVQEVTSSTLLAHQNKTTTWGIFKRAFWQFGK